MDIPRNVLLDHLRRVRCGGQIGEVVFRPGLAVSALTPDHLMLVEAPALDEAEDLIEDEVGLGALDLLIKTCSGFFDHDEDGEDVVDLVFEDHRLVVDETVGRVRILTAEPRTIATRVESKVVSSLLEKIGDKVVPISASLVENVKRAFSGLKAAHVTLFCGEGGGLIRVGDVNDHVAELAVEDLVFEGEGFEIVLGPHFIDVLATLSDEAPVAYFSGPESTVTLQDGLFHYILSPISDGGAKKKRKKKSAKKEEAEASA